MPLRYLPGYSRGFQLEAFSAVHTVTEAQARDVSTLVESQKSWLEQVQPDTVSRYRSRRRAIHDVARLARSEQLTAFIIKHNGIARGLGYLITDQMVTHPAEGEIEGTDIDYWLEAGSSRILHTATAHHLVRASYNRDHHKVFATVPVNHPNPAIGFQDELDKIGSPAVLTTSMPEDPFDIIKSGVMLQLYGKNQA